MLKFALLESSLVVSEYLGNRRHRFNFLRAEMTRQLYRTSPNPKTPAHARQLAELFDGLDFVRIRGHTAIVCMARASRSRLLRSQDAAVAVIFHVRLNQV